MRSRCARASTSTIYRASRWARRGKIELDGKTYAVAVKRIYPEVVNDAFTVDIDFAGAAPPGLRRGQRLTTELSFGASTQGLIVERGGFVQHSGGRWVYLIAEDGRSARRAPVRFGRQNPRYLEVLEGLRPNDRIVTSSYTTFNDVDELRVHGADSHPECRHGRSPMIIETQGLKKLYRTDLVETTALDSVNFSVDAGQFVSIMGPSGCGKSTLLHILGLIDTPSDGNYRFLGEDVSRYPESKRAAIRKRNIGFVFQSFNLIDELTVYENVELPLVYAKTPARERQAKVDAVLERMDIGHRRDHLPGQLSGGQQQRVAVARAVVHQPNLILADEPTGNLDSEHGAEVMKILVRLHEEGTSIVMVTHSPDNAAYAERTVRMLDGRILAEQRPGS